MLQKTTLFSSERMMVIRLGMISKVGQSVSGIGYMVNNANVLPQVFWKKYEAERLEKERLTGLGETQSPEPYKSPDSSYRYYRERKKEKISENKGRGEGKEIGLLLKMARLNTTDTNISIFLV